jgi:hypothetical protein
MSTFLQDEPNQVVQSATRLVIHGYYKLRVPCKNMDVPCFLKIDYLLKDEQVMLHMFVSQTNATPSDSDCQLQVSNPNRVKVLPEENKNGRRFQASFIYVGFHSEAKVIVIFTPAFDGQRVNKLA